MARISDPNRRTSKRTSRATGSRTEARANRRLQLVVSNTHPGLRGKTLMEQMEDRLDATFKQRKELLEVGLKPSLDENRGKIQGMLEMIAIMRSTDKKTELERSKIRRQYDGKD